MSVADDAALHRSLLSSMHDYLQRKGFEKTAKSFEKELKAAGWSLETSNCLLENLWTLNQGVEKEKSVSESLVEDDRRASNIEKSSSRGKEQTVKTSSRSSGNSPGEKYVDTKETGSLTPSKSKLAVEEETSSTSSGTSASTSSTETDSSRSSSPKNSSPSNRSESSSSESSQSGSSFRSSSSNPTQESSSSSSSGSSSSSEESDSSHYSSSSSSSSKEDKESATSKDSNESSESESSVSTGSEDSKSSVSSSSESSSTSSNSDSSDTQSSSYHISNSSDSSSTDVTSSSSSNSAQDVKDRKLASKAKEKEGISSSKRLRDDTQELRERLDFPHDSSGNNVDHATKVPSEKKFRTNANGREDALTSITCQDSSRQGKWLSIYFQLHSCGRFSAPERVKVTLQAANSEKPNSEKPDLNEGPSEIDDENSSTLRRFQRVQPDSVKFIDDKLRDNSYDAKGGEMYGLRAWEELKKVRGKDFRKAKTKKKKATYFGGGIISKDSHSFRFTYSDDSS
ncbi:hypothetical protein Gasu_20310 isoform 2 [Galdieria sulphuraria]|uniref:Srp40 C-terminal domain-containing protein n=1 Tax=Galdieria sulphuraria TaxID=130081 RepID=M2XKA0_GALSU|nr:hypothetical protein Gasu_20310 isoform 2 [Galdieria sulphuraria]EME30567.1 hypothetical protein isoform 2 [Galdieria sulphuraria]|eukprot:XP_005707087.1 hypothetical protein isoform 2 [Galdieria sulphuraria]